VLSHARTSPPQADINIPRHIIVESFRDQAVRSAITQHSETGHRTSMVPFDLQELDDSYVIYIYIDACPWEKLLVSVNEGMLYIKAAADSAAHGGWQNWCGNSSIGFLLPANARAESVQAYCQNEFLKVVIRKN